MFQNRARPIFHSGIVGNIERREAVWVRKFLLKSGDGDGIASAPVDRVALGRKKPGHGQPQPASGSGENDGFGHGFGRDDEIKIQLRRFAKPFA